MGSPRPWTWWLAVFSALELAPPAAALRVAHPRALRIEGADFVLGDRKVHLHAGEMHYFRIPEVHWEDRLMRLRAMGLNAVSTYVPWNWHEQTEGVFDFSSDRKDLVRYLQLANKHGLMVILRPGPYVCSEWDFGGLPSWLLRYSLAGRDLQVRTGNELYLQFVDRYWAQLLPLVRPQLLEEGGGIVAVVLENEFGHFGDANTPADRRYLDHLHNLARRHLGPEVLLLTTDESSSTKKGKGSIPGIFSSVNMGPWEPPANRHLDREFGHVSSHNKGGPEFVMELWTGWFQQWRRDMLFDFAFKVRGEQLADYVQELVRRGASFTLYMAHGGTNFGFWNSAVFGSGGFVTTSYDYAAPISEAGLHNRGGDGVDKFEAIRQVLAAEAARAGEPAPPPEPAPPRLAAYPGSGPRGEVPLERQAVLRDPAVLSALCAGGWRSASTPAPMEVFGQHAGMTLYRYHVSAGEATAAMAANATSKPRLTLEARDRVSVWRGAEEVTRAWLKSAAGLLNPSPKDSLTVELASLEHGDTLDVLVENLGRRAFFMRNTNDDKNTWEEWKGLRQAKLNDKPLEGHWEVCMLPLDDVGAVDGVRTSVGALPPGPAFFRGAVAVDGEPADTFLRLDVGSWNAGVAFVNGFNLGRYWRQANAPFDFYVPKSALRAGENEVLLLDVDPPAAGPLAVRLEATRATAVR